MITPLAKIDKHDGFTLLEMVLVVVILAIFSVTWITKTPLISSLKVSSFQNDFMMTLHYARQLALVNPPHSIYLVINQQGFGITKEDSYVKHPDGLRIYPIAWPDEGSSRQLSIHPEGKFEFDEFGGMQNTIKFMILTPSTNLKICLSQTGLVYEC
ncbi:MAG: type II secretion system protein [Pseudomonadota bacterium]